MSLKPRRGFYFFSSKKVNKKIRRFGCLTGRDCTKGGLLQLSNIRMRPEKVKGETIQLHDPLSNMKMSHPDF